MNKTSTVNALSMQLVDIARVHLGLATLESPTSKGGFLSVHVGDALSSAASVNGGFSGGYTVSVSF